MIYLHLGDPELPWNIKRAREVNKKIAEHYSAVSSIAQEDLEDDNDDEEEGGNPLGPLPRPSSASAAAAPAPAASSSSQLVFVVVLSHIDLCC